MNCAAPTAIEAIVSAAPWAEPDDAGPTFAVVVRGRALDLHADEFELLRDPVTGARIGAALLAPFVEGTSGSPAQIAWAREYAA